jgi:hypothetical protein
MRAPVRRPRVRARPAGELRDSPTRRAATVAITAAVLGVLLIGGVPTLASFAATSTGTALSITSGSLSGTVSAPVVGTAAIAAAPTRVIVRPGTPGMVPGVQSQTLTYTVTNTGSARAPAAASVRVLSTAVTDSAAWGGIQPYLQVTAQIGSAAAVPVTATASGIDVTVTSTAAIQPGASVPVVLTFTLPATSGGIDLYTALLPYAGTSSGLGIRSILTLQPQVTLTQVAVMAP